GAVWSTTGFGEGADFAWFVAADDLTAPALVAVAAGPSPSLQLSSSSTEAEIVDVVSDAGAGESRQVTVPAGGDTTVTVDSGQVYQIVPGTGGVR
ncbi:hypothetical protein ACC848_38900, partial [Rhizobium johnstonii]